MHLANKPSTMVEATFLSSPLRKVAFKCQTNAGPISRGRTRGGAIATPLDIAQTKIRDPFVRLRDPFSWG